MLLKWDLTHYINSVTALKTLSSTYTPPVSVLVAKAIAHHKAIARLTKPTVQIKYSTEQNVDSNDNQIGSCEISVSLTMSSMIQHSDPHPKQGLGSLRMMHVGQALSSSVKLGCIKAAT
jgi:hypothetical protein